MAIATASTIQSVASAIEGPISVRIVDSPAPRADLFLGGIKNNAPVISLSGDTNEMVSFWPDGAKPRSEVQVAGLQLTWRLKAASGRSLVRTFRLDRTRARVQITTVATLEREGTSAGPLFSEYRFESSGADPKLYVPSAPAGSIYSDDAFLSPVAAVAGGGRRAVIVPDLHLLAESRPFPAVLSGSRRTISYGFHPGIRRVRPGVYEVSDPAATRRMPKMVSWGETVVLSSPPAGSPVTSGLASLLWDIYGRGRIQKSALPQEAPLLYYTKPTYEFAIDEAQAAKVTPEDRKRSRQWWQDEVGGVVVGAPNGKDTVTWGVADNNLRAAWGMRWWSRAMKQADWIAKSEAMLNLYLSCPTGPDGFASSFHISSRSWTRNHSIPSLSVSGTWLLRWVGDFRDLPQEAAIVDRIEELAKLAIGQMQPDGTYRTESGPLVVPQAITFLTEFAFSPQVKNQPLQALAKAAVRTSVSLDRLGETLSADNLPANTLPASLATAEALAAKARISQDRSQLILAGKVLRRAALMQSVWSMPYRSSKDTFGAFATAGQYDIITTHAAGIYLTIGSALQDVELMERGAAALRSVLDTGIGPIFGQADRTHAPGQGIGRASQSFGQLGTDRFGEWPGFDVAEGQILATIANALDRWGGFTRSTGKWGVGIDGLGSTKDGKPVALLWLNNPPYAKYYPVEIFEAGRPRETREDIRPNLRLRDVKAVMRGDRIVLVAFPGFSASAEFAATSSAEFLYADGQRIRANVSADGWESEADIKALLAGPVRFVLRTRSETHESEPWHVFVVPDLRVVLGGPRGWHKSGDLADTGYPSDWHNSLPWLSTADDGTGVSRPGLVGTIRSADFLVTEPVLRMEFRGIEGARLALVDAESLEELETYEGGTVVQVETVEWDLSFHRGKRVFVRLHDHSSTGWVAVTGFEFLTNVRRADSMYRVR